MGFFKECVYVCMVDDPKPKGVDLAGKKLQKQINMIVRIQNDCRLYEKSLA